MKNESFKMIEITEETKKALVKEIKRQKKLGYSLEDILNIWDKGCKNRDYLEWGNKLTRELWSELEKQDNSRIKAIMNKFSIYRLER